MIHRIIAPMTATCAFTRSVHPNLQLSPNKLEIPNSKPATGTKV